MAPKKKSPAPNSQTASREDILASLQAALDRHGMNSSIPEGFYDAKFYAELTGTKNVNHMRWRMDRLVELGEYEVFRSRLNGGHPKKYYRKKE